MTTRSEWQGQKLGLLDQQSRLSQVCVHISHQLAISQEPGINLFSLQKRTKNKSKEWSYNRAL